MNETVLFVDDEEYILNAVRRLFEENDLSVLCCQNPEEALDIFLKQEIGVVVSDNMMPQMKGVDFLSKVKVISPHTVRILMTAFADLTTALQAINSGEVFRFILKPWNADDLVKTVCEGLARHRVICTMERENEAVLRSLAQTIELKDQYTRGHCDRVAAFALMIATKMELPVNTLRDIRHGSWLHDCGKIGVPESILNFNGKLSSDEFITVKKHPEWGADVAAQANLSSTIINIIRHHHECFDGSGYPDGLKGENIPIEARIVAVADIFDALTSHRPYKEAFSHEKAQNILIEMTENALDPALVNMFLSALAENQLKAGE